MPNWCNNVITLQHDDAEMIEKIAACDGSDQGVLQTLIPCPEELLDSELTTSYGDDAKQAIADAKREAAHKKYGYQSWYDWCIANWGTKWDLCEPSFNRIDDNTIQISCDTAWSPPVGAYEKLMEMGFNVRAYYYEGGMVFAGIWDNGDDQCYSEWGDSEGARATLPQELDDTFAISESQAEWEEEERREEELYAFVKDGAEANENVRRMNKNIDEFNKDMENEGL